MRDRPKLSVYDRLDYETHATDNTIIHIISDKIRVRPIYKHRPNIKTR